MEWDIRREVLHRRVCEELCGELCEDVVMEHCKAEHLGVLEHSGDDRWEEGEEEICSEHCLVAKHWGEKA